MYGPSTTNYQDWVAEEWAAEDPARDLDTAPHWTKYEWVGDQGHGVRTAGLTAAQMPEGERGLSGFRHTAPAAHWVPAS
ncbi:MAG: hypothetical protein ACP5VP_01830 [Candidatus Limnocylindrales bacterium]